MMLQAFGRQAQQFADRFDGAELLVTEPAHTAAALEAALDRHRQGVPFFVCALFDEPRAALALRLGSELIRTNRSIDERRHRFDELAHQLLVVEGQPQAAAAKIDAQTHCLLREYLQTAPAVWNRSLRDSDRVSRLLDVRERFTVSAPGRDARVPQFTPLCRERIVVWAPDLRADELCVIAVALGNFRYPVSYVVKSWHLDGMPDVHGRFVPVAQAQAELERAVCAIDASIGDPAGAISLAERGLTVAAATTAGSAEFLDGALEYDPWNWRHVHQAVSIAIGAPATRLKRDPFARADIQRTLRRAQAEA